MKYVKSSLNLIACLSCEYYIYVGIYHRVTELTKQTNQVEPLELLLNNTVIQTSWHEVPRM